MAVESSKATRDDDIFDSDAMRPYWANEGAVEASDFLPVGEDEEEQTGGGGLFEDLQLFDPTHHAAGAGAALGAGSSAHRRAFTGHEGEHDSEEEIQFASSHVHKLHYHPPSKLFPMAAVREPSNNNRGGPNNKGAGGNKVVKHLSSNLVRKQVTAAVQGAKASARGNEDSEEGSGGSSSDLDSDEEDGDL
jgi:hypothetical protein